MKIRIVCLGTCGQGRATVYDCTQHVPLSEVPLLWMRYRLFAHSTPLDGQPRSAISEKAHDNYVFIWREFHQLTSTSSHTSRTSPSRLTGQWSHHPDCTVEWTVDYPADIRMGQIKPPRRLISPHPQRQFWQAALTPSQTRNTHQTGANSAAMPVDFSSRSLLAGSM